MKVKLLAVTEEDIKNGLNIKDTYEVNKVEISGDYCAYDICYYVKNNKNEDICFMDLTTEEIESDERLDVFIANFNDFMKVAGNKVPYKFLFKLHLD